MRERLQIPLPMWRVQYYLLGGGQRMLLVSGICATLLIVGTAAIRRFFPKDPFPAVAGWVLNFVAAVQVLATLLGGCNAVYRALLRDYETKMIESHRLTPMSNVAVALGYLFGPTLQVLLLFLIFTVFGMALSFLAGLPTENWALGNLLVLVGALPFWALVVFSGVRLDKPFNPAPVVVGIAALTVPILFVPGAALLMNTYTVYFGVRTLTSTGTVPVAAALVPAVVSLLMAAFWLYVAAVKYRRPDLPALNGLRGLVLLSVALFLGTVGLWAFERIARTSMRQFYDPGMLLTQWIATMVGGWILGCVAVSGAVKCRILVTRGTAPRDWSDRISDLLVVVLSVLLICGLMAGVGATIWPELLSHTYTPRGGGPGLPLMDRAIRVWGWTFAACLLALLTIRSVSEVAYTRLKSSNAMLGVFVLAVWAVPPLADLIRAEYLREFHRQAEYSWFFGCSPAGTVIAAWCDLGVGVVPGLGVQALTAAALIVLARRVCHRTNRRVTAGASTESHGT